MLIREKISEMPSFFDVPEIPYGNESAVKG